VTEPSAGRLPPVDACLNCGADVAASAYCGTCGQRAVDLRIGLRGLVREAASLVSSLDSKVLRTAWALLARPGVVAAEYIAGHRVRWVSPVRVFLGAVALYVLVGAGYTQRLAGGEELRGLAGEAAAAGAREAGAAAPASGAPEPLVIEVEELLDDLQRSMPTIMKVAFLLAAPGMILLLALVELRRRRPLFDHAVTGLYLLSLVAVVQLVEQPAGLALRALADLPPLRAHLTANVAINLVFLVVLALWLRRVYGDRLGAALGKALVLLAGLEVTIALGAALISAVLAVVYIL
jgi:hypothetical protein